MTGSFNQISDEGLVRAAEQGDRAAFNEIVRRYCRPLTEFASAKMATIQDAEDVVQDTFLRVFQNLHVFDSSYSLKNWMFTIAYRLIISEYRRKKPVRLGEQAADAIPGESAEADGNLDEIWQHARRLGNDEYLVLWLRYKQGMKTSEIAKVMQKTIAGVRVRLHRARKRLGRQLQSCGKVEDLRIDPQAVKI